MTNQQLAERFEEYVKNLDPLTDRCEYDASAQQTARWEFNNFLRWLKARYPDEPACKHPELRDGLCMVCYQQVEPRVKRGPYCVTKGCLYEGKLAHPGCRCLSENRPSEPGADPDDAPDSTAQFAALIADAERYRWMRQHFQYGGYEKHRLDWYLPRSYDGTPLAEQLDAAIDEQRNK